MYIYMQICKYHPFPPVIKTCKPRTTSRFNSIHVYVYTYICIYTCIHVHMYIYMYTCTYVYIYPHITHSRQWSKRENHEQPPDLDLWSTTSRPACRRTHSRIPGFHPFWIREAYPNHARLWSHSLKRAVSLVAPAQTILGSASLFEKF